MIRSRAGVASLFQRAPGWLWASLATVVAMVPFAGVFTRDKVFYLRDLSYCFWDRYLWLRRSLVSGEWPLWDPYLAAGQSAAADALHQMFFLPGLAVRLLGSEVVGFNLWVALPYPLAALGVYGFLRSRFSAPAAALGAVAFAVSGPVVSAGSFPNMSWAVAVMPWVLWAADRCDGPRLGRRVGMLALAFALEGAAGEPVTMAATAVLAVAMSLGVGTRDGASAGWRARGVAALAVVGGLALGALIGAVQLVPMMTAVQDSYRPLIRTRDFWSLHPLVLVETVAPHLFGNYFEAPSLSAAPWLGALNSGRAAFFYSVYVGPAVFALAAAGALAGARRRWGVFWVAVGVVGVVGACGGHTPVYPFVRAYLPVLGSFRFPVKYLVFSVMALAVLVAAGWDAMAVSDPRQATSRRDRIARYAGVMLPLALGLGATILGVVVQTSGSSAARWFADLASWAGVPDPPNAGAFLVRAVRGGLWKLALLALGVSALVAVAVSRRPEARLARATLFGVLVLDLLNAAWSLNPTCPVALLDAPPWTHVVQAHPESRFYFGGRVSGLIDPRDTHAPAGFTSPPELPMMVRRAIMGRQTVLYPGGVGAREMISYDLPVLWPRIFNLTWQRFGKAPHNERERFLSRTAVRYRLLPESKGGGRPAMAAGAFVGFKMYDAGAAYTRAFVVQGATTVQSQDAQLQAMFGPEFDDRRMVMLLQAAGPADGQVSAPVEHFARFVEDAGNRVTIEAGTGPAGGFLVLLDSYSPDWEVVVDGTPGTLYRANLLFRAVRLAPGRHTVEFHYRPRMVRAGAALSCVGVMGLWLVASKVRRSRRP